MPVHHDRFVSSVMTQNCPPVSKSKDAALLALMDRSGYPIVQENGQRKYGPPPDWNGPPPEKGSEVFVGKIPRDLHEDELVPVFENIGKIYEVRLMMDFSGTNRGYAFVMYTDPQDAKTAVKKLDNFEIRKGKFIGVCKSVDNCRLFVGGIPKMKGKEEILTEMKKITDDVVNVILYSSVVDKTKNRGFAFVEYGNHRSAAMARRKLIPGKIQLWGHDIAVDWAEPEPEISEEIMATVTILYVRNLMLTTTEDQIREVFSLNGRLKVEKVKKLRDFAFIHYKTREEAQAALKACHNYILDGSVLEVMWAKPVDKGYKKSIRGNTTPIIGAYAPVMYTNPGAYDVFGYGASFPYTSASSMPNGSMMVPRITIRGRTRGAAGLRGGRQGYGGNYRKAAERFVTLQPSMELIPTNPYTLKPVRSSSQILSDYCQKNNLGEPIYNLHSTHQNDNGDSAQLFVYKVTIPGLAPQYNQFHPPKLFHHIEEAKQYAAEFVLGQLGVPIESSESPLGPVQLASSGGPSIAAHYGSPGRMGPVGYLTPAGYDGYCEAFHIPFY